MEGTARPFNGIAEKKKHTFNTYTSTNTYTKKCRSVLFTSVTMCRSFVLYHIGFWSQRWPLSCTQYIFRASRAQKEWIWKHSRKMRAHTWHRWGFPFEWNDEEKKRTAAKPCIRGAKECRSSFWTRQKINSMCDVFLEMYLWPFSWT